MSSFARVFSPLLLACLVGPVASATDTTGIPEDLLVEEACVDPLTGDDLCASIDEAVIAEEEATSDGWFDDDDDDDDHELCGTP